MPCALLVAGVGLRDDAGWETTLFNNVVALADWGRAHSFVAVELPTFKRGGQVVEGVS